ncbi:polyprenyl synthetase family protein [Effusibacillus dendaii]|uniref:Farnesyl diphosphate synthase n=1 Tax=Effusibacillus dendaii TaxID=2743772 RepID=A0A7I8DDE4_9BACL|nr:farnesyl diphosphate synthase [Effusibacillus dendaii]BCJ85911.1 farnesyl-diphosphate synthase [Effusibacillus dendaii]
MSFVIEDYLKEAACEVEQAMDKLLPSGKERMFSRHAGLESTGLLIESMRYSLFAGGKRIRPILALATVETLGGNRQAALPVACSLELIHTYSLIHDDLPAMDDDDFRRGKPTNHKVYGEAVAVLAGDALLTLAFQVLSQVEMPQREKELLQLIRILSDASGYAGMIGGQMADIQAEGKQPDPQTLEFIHRHKTGDLLRAAVQMGAVFAGANEQEILHLTLYAMNLGLAFQIQDDLLDVEGNADQLGKSTGADEAHGKLTYPSLFGLEESHKKLNETTQQALSALNHLPHDTTVLREIANYLLTRVN